MTGSRGFSFPNTRTRCEPVAKRVRAPAAASAHPERARSAPPTNRVRTRSSPKAIKALRDQLTAAVERETRLIADLAAERERADREADKAGKAIAAFASLAERLDALAAERARPWWRRLAR